MSADQTPTSCELEEAQLIWDTSAGVNLSIDEAVFRNVASAVNKDLTGAFTDKK